MDASLITASQHDCCGKEPAYLLPEMGQIDRDAMFVMIHLVTCYMVNRLWNKHERTKRIIIKNLTNIVK